MKVYLGAVGENDQAGILQSHSGYSKSHEIVADPSAADVILIFGATSREPQRLLESGLYKAFPERCACLLYTSSIAFPAQNRPLGSFHHREVEASFAR